MGGLVLDILIAFLFKNAKRVFHFFQSSKWERTPAFIRSAVTDKPDLGCSSVLLHYRFISNGERTEGSYEIPFWSTWSAQGYAEQFSKDDQVIIRVNPENAEETCYFELDQKAAVTAPESTG